MAIVVIPHPRGVVRIPEQLVTGEEEGVWHLALGSRIGGPYGATERQREQQCYQRHNQRSRDGQQPPWPRSPLRCLPYVGRSMHSRSPPASTFSLERFSTCLST